LLAPDQLTPEGAREAVLGVLADPAYRRNAQRVRDEIAALPGPGDGVSLLERLAAERAPLVAERPAPAAP
jgi:UDP:flavonoid glycosyltransferase YjiC (YdhE family)